MKVIKINDFKNLPKNYTGIVENPHGSKYWFLNGKRHREVGPCTTCKDCLKGNFELCSKPGPAVEHPNGTKAWFLNGKLHRIDGPCTTCKDCLKGNFELCSKPGPAIERSNGTKYWYLNGQLHRENGPAIEYPDGIKTYGLNGKLLDKNKINQFIEEFEYPVETAIELVVYLEKEEEHLGE